MSAVPTWKLLLGEVFRAFEKCLFRSRLTQVKSPNYICYRSIVICGLSSETTRIAVVLDKLIDGFPAFEIWLDSAITMIGVISIRNRFGAYFFPGETIVITQGELLSDSSCLACILARRITFARLMRRRGFTYPRMLRRHYLSALRYELRVSEVMNASPEYVGSIKRRCVSWNAM